MLKDKADGLLCPGEFNEDWRGVRMYKAFEIAGYSREGGDGKFGHMIRAFEYGAPPHGGNAPGIDRLLTVLLDCDSIRDIYVFPKDGQGRDVMLDAPSEVAPERLEELYIELKSLFETC